MRNVERLIARAGATIAARGRAYYAQKWRLRVQHVSAEEAVEFMRAGGSVLVFCDCPYAGYEEDAICKHGVAAALFLRDHLKQNAPVPWEDVLSQAVRTSSRRAPARTGDAVAGDAHLEDLRAQTRLRELQLLA